MHQNKFLRDVYQLMYGYHEYTQQNNKKFLTNNFKTLSFRQEPYVNKYE